MGRSIQCLFIAAVCFAVCTAEAQTAADYNAAGVERYNAQDWDGAIEAFARAYDIAPTNETVRRNLCNTYQAKAHAIAKTGEFGDVEVGARILEQAIRIDAGNPAPLIQLGSYYLRLDWDTDAVFKLQEALQLEPSNLTAMELLGDAHYKANDLVSAVSTWEYILEQGEDPGIRQKLDKARRELDVEGSYKSAGSQNFQISFAPGTRYYEVNELTRILESARRDIGRKLGGVYPVKTVQVIAYTATDFSQATDLGEHIGALYDGKIRVPIENKAGERLPADEMRRRLYHEYTHVVVRELGGERVPWWLNEGLAETLSNPLSDDDRLALQEARDTATLFKLADLERGQLELLDPASLSVAYRQSHATVDYLINRFGQRKMVALLQTLGAGIPADEALRQTYRRRYAEIELEVNQTLPRG